MNSFITNAILLALLVSTVVTAGPVQATLGDAHDSRIAPNSSLEIRSLERRNGMLHCCNFATGSGMTANDLIVGVQNDNEHSIAAQGCLRIGCEDTTGLYVCNDRDETLTVTGNEISNHAINIVKGCCKYSADGSTTWSRYISGQQFTDALDGNWNVVIGYANCNHDASQKPSEIGGWGVNKPCKQFNTYIS